MVIAADYDRPGSRRSGPQRWRSISGTVGNRHFPPTASTLRRLRQSNNSSRLKGCRPWGVLDSRFALGFVEGRVREETIEAREFRRDRIVAVVAPGHTLAKQRALSVQALAAAPSILREPGSGTREIVERAFARHRLVVRCGLQISNSEALKRAALSGAGVGWISEVCVVEELRAGRLVSLKTPRLSLERPLYFLRLRGRHLNRSACAFLQDFEQPEAALDS